MISTFCCWPPSMMVAVWKSFAGCFCCSADWLRDWFINDWFLLDESCFKLSISSCRCLICLLNPSSLVWFVDELDRDGAFPLSSLMFSAFSCSIVVLCWVVVDIFVLLDFVYKSVLLRLRFNISDYKVLLVLLGLYFKLLYFLNFRCCKTFLVESSFSSSSLENFLLFWCLVHFNFFFHKIVQCLSLTIARIAFVLNTSYLKISGHDYQLSVQVLLQVL